MNCRDVNQLLLSYLDNEVNLKDREAINTHLSVCPACRDEMETLANTLGELRQGLQEVAAGASPSHSAWGSIKERLVREEQRKSPLLDLRGFLRNMNMGNLRRVPTLEKAAVSCVLIGALVVGLISVLASPNLKLNPQHTIGDLPLGPLSIASDLGANQLVSFASEHELEEFVQAESGNLYYDDVKGGINELSADSSAPSDYSVQNGQSGDTPDYSETNIQVEGVDEADVVKTDGSHLYVVLENRIVIAKAYPANRARILCEIELEGELEGIYIKEDRLVVFETLRLEQWYSFQTYLKVYDVSDKANPILQNEFAVDGQYGDSRMVGDYVYAVIDQLAYYDVGDVNIPKIHLEDTIFEIPVQEILYPAEEEYGKHFSTVIAFNICTEKQDIEHLGYGMFLLGTNSNLYVSPNNIYITCTDYDIETGSLSGEEKLSIAYSQSERTVIHRIHFESGIMEYDASGEVPGRLLNQFSMDEYEEHFRIATTTGNVWDATSKNHLHVLDSNLEIAGTLENLAPGERIYSARFMGERGYLVTFVKVDPLFVIDLSDPTTPTVLGELKITGYSDYLHPYDENHLIGIGKETIDGFYQGMKISLFDVSDVSNPMELAKYEIGDRGTDSPVLNDHKALLFDRARNLLVLPVLVREQGNYVWQGAYVFNISVEGGLELRGQITHHDSDDLSQSWWGYYSSSLSIKRSLYIGEVLYTISDAKIKMNDLESLDVINEVELPERPKVEPGNIDTAGSIQWIRQGLFSD